MGVWAIKKAREGDDRVREVELQVIGLAFFDSRVQDLCVSYLLALGRARPLSGLQESNLHVDAIRLLRGDFQEHVGLWSDLDGLSCVDEAQEDVVVENETLSVSVLDKSALYEGLR